MLSLSKKLLIGVFLFFPALLFGQSAAITIDGDFSDWTPGLATYVDGVDNPGNVDLLDMQVTNDADFLYVKWTMDTELCINDNVIPHNIWLHLDTDDDPSTGFSPQTGYGSEASYGFNAHYGWFNVPNPDITVDFSAFQMRISPSVSSTTFECAIGRNAKPNGVDDLFQGNTVRVLIRENDSNDRMPDVGTVFSYTFDETPVTPLVPIDLNKSDPNHIRILTYNVLNDGLESGSRVDNFESIITAMSPDIIGFSECNGTPSSTAKSLLDTWLPLGTPDGWYAVKDQDMITCSKWPIIDSWSLDRQFPVLIDLTDHGSQMLYTNTHLSWGGGNGSRQDDIDEFCAFILDAKTPGGVIDLPLLTPFVYGGDVNFVSLAQQLETLVTGDIQDTGTYGSGAPLDWDDTDLLDLVPIQSDKRMAYTWRDDGNTYPPLRIDIQVASDATLNVEKSFVLQTEVMAPDRLALYSLDSYDTGDASDHFPVVADYSLILASDLDGDLIPDESDNCPDDPNFDQADWNNDGIGDVCQDSDGDNLLDSDEILTYTTDPGDPDSDDDGLNDGDEINIHGSDPLDKDTDGDGLTDGLEVSVGGISPLLSDTDGDGCSDDLEFSLQCPDNLCNSCPGDLDGNGFVDTADLLGFLAVFGQPCE